jgi:hypothetical protein
MKQRLLSPEGLLKRLALLDNIKSLRFSWAALEELITQDTISGKALYVGEASRPNTLTWVLTVNGASLSKDLAGRVVPIRLKRPAYDPSWLDRVLAHLAKHRWAVIGDIIAALRERPPAVIGASRWSVWQREILARAAGSAERVSACQKLIQERQAETDDDDDTAEVVRQSLREHLRIWGHSPEDDAVLIRVSYVATVYRRALEIRNLPANQATRAASQLTIPELHRAGNRRGLGYFEWRCPGVTKEQVALDARRAHIYLGTDILYASGNTGGRGGTEPSLVPALS